MRVNIDGRDLLVKRTTRGMVELQRQTGWDLAALDTYTKEGYGAAMAAFFALSNAGFSPVFDDLLDRDLADFKFTAEPGDEAPAPATEADAVDPQTSRADSDPGGAEAPAEPVTAG